MRKVIIIFLLFVTACTSEPKNKSVQKNSNSVNTNSFNSFFEHFKRDSLFQIAHVKFPFSYSQWELGSEKPEVAKISRNDWRHLKFQYDSNYATREIDAYTQEIKSYGDTVKIELRGVDNGIMIDYEFVKINGRWFLVAEKDYSS